MDKATNCEVNLRKVAVIGCGFVGSTCAFALMQTGMFSEMVLLDADKGRAEGEALDLSLIHIWYTACPQAYPTATTRAAAVFPSKMEQ